MEGNVDRTRVEKSMVEVDRGLSTMSDSNTNHITADINLKKDCYNLVDTDQAKEGQGQHGGLLSDAQRYQLDGQITAYIALISHKPVPEASGQGLKALTKQVRTS